MSYKWMVGLTLLVAVPLFAQEEETLIDGKIESGGFGAPVWKVSTLNGETVGLAGGRGGWILNHWLALGGGGYSTLRDASIDLVNPDNSEPLFVRMEYSGFEIEYINRPGKLIHWTACALVGGGRLEVREHKPDRTYARDNFTVVDAALNVELNAVKWCRLNVGGGYRAAFGVETSGLKNEDISGPEAHVTLKFGDF